MALVALVALSACGRRCGDVDASRDAAASADGALTGACAADGPSFELDVELVDVGGALPLPRGGVAVALARRREAGGGRTGAVARVEGGALEVHATAALAPDAPPPSLALAGSGALFAASFAEQAPDGGRARRVLEVERVLPDRASLGTVPVGPADAQVAALALAADGSGLVVWDEERERDGGAAGAGAGTGAAGSAAAAAIGAAPPTPFLAAPSTRRGVVRAVAFSAATLGAPATISGGLDAERPAVHVLPEGRGFVVAWIASSPEPIADADVDAAEGPGEARARRWVEVRRVDAAGAPRADVERGGTGYERATAFTLAARDGGLDLFVADEAAVHESEGGRLLAVPLEPRLGASVSAWRVADGVARLHEGLVGLPVLVESPDERQLVAPEPTVTTGAGAASDSTGAGDAGLRDVGLPTGMRPLAPAGASALWVISARPGSARAVLGRVVCPRLGGAP